MKGSLKLDKLQNYLIDGNFAYVSSLPEIISKIN